MSRMIEGLEGRRLLHGVTLNNGVLTITGSAAGDTYSFSSGKNSFTLYPADGGVAENPETYLYSQVTSVNIDAGDGNDTISLGKLRVPSVIRGGTGNDLIFGGMSSDYIRGDGGKDTIFGNDGGDRLDGGNGGDLMDGGAGRDTADYTKRTGNLTITLGDVYDDGEANENDNVRGNIEIVKCGSGNDSVTTTRGRAVEFWGFEGTDTLTGGSGNDTFHGGDYPDLLYGNAGNDVFYSNDDAAGGLFAIDQCNGGSGSNVAHADSNDEVNQCTRV
ncbi:MAG: calcium-binding protein [Tepidisphaeraceae bacterium]